MQSQQYVATKSLSQGRLSYSMIFRHPLKKDRAGKTGMRVRRGLGTSVETEADTLIQQMNDILRDESMWSPAARDRASTLFDSRVVAAFFDALEPVQSDSWVTRGARIPLPSREDGYVRALALGTTGAGKTTLIRQLIGSHPDRDRFPSTSAAKTTVADHEIILTANHSFRAVVSFFAKDLVQSWIEDCIAAAVLAVVDHKDESTVMRRLLEHRDQRFRLSYTIGTPRVQRDSIVEDEDLDASDEPPLSDDEILAGQSPSRLAAHLSAVNGLATTMTAYFEESLRESVAELRKSSERDAFEEMFESELRAHRDFQMLVDDVVDDVEARFTQLSPKDVQFTSDGWPELWYMEATDRDRFLFEVRRFSSNDSRLFGSLLTPLVDGIRVSGPFHPDWLAAEDVRLVLLDGEGIGHTAESMTSLPMTTTRRFEDVDAVLLVDDASQPMLGASLTALRALVTSGHADKLIFCFTHFDQVRGANLRSTVDKQSHVTASAENAFAQIAKQLDRSALRPLQKALDERTVFVGNIHRDLLSPEIESRVQGTVSQLRSLFVLLESMAVPTAGGLASPKYDQANLVLAVQKGVQDFHEAWNARLGMPSRTTLRKEHWTRVRALSRYISQFGLEGYDTLEPVADLVTMLRERLWVFVDAPVGWIGAATDETEMAVAIASVAAEVNRRLYNFAKRRVLHERFSEWLRAFQFSGTGSSFQRAREIGMLYDVAAPVPGDRPDPFGNEFLTEVRELVREAIESVNGRLV